MKKVILKIIAICLVATLNFTGCTQVIEGGVQIPDSSIVEKNVTTKLYYEDTNNSAIKEDLKNFVEFLNKQDEMKTKFVSSEVKSPDDIRHTIIGMDRIDFKFIKNDNNKALRLKFSVDNNSNFIIADKKYSSADEVCSDFLTLAQFIFENVKGKTDLLDQIGY
jgi:hypothetical protein